MKHLISYAIVIVALYKVVTSFTQNLEYGLLFSVQTNIWVYRVLWTVAGVVSAHTIYKIYKDKSQFSRKKQNP